MISQDKGKVTLVPSVPPPFLYQNSQRVDGISALRVEREEGSHKDQLCILSGVKPGTPAIIYFLIQSFTATETYVEFIEYQ